MWDILLWVSVLNATLLIVHEIDSAYWREWELFRLPAGAGGFLAIHVPLVFVVLAGLVLLVDERRAGLVLALLVAVGGVFAFVIHRLFIARGNRQFTTMASQSILAALLVVSLAQAALAVVVLLG